MIAHRLINTIVFKGRKIKLNLKYDAVLRVFELQKDKLFSDSEKIDVSLRMLTKHCPRLLPSDKVELFKILFDQHIMAGKKRGESGEKSVDFQQDAAYIYSSFLMDYGIDLQKEQGRMDWRVFIALFQGLSERTKIREVMQIRTRKLPSPNKYNADEIEAIREAKQYYALEVSEEEAEQQFQKGLAKLAQTLGGLAANNGKRND